MHIDKFEMERMQVQYENVVDYNLSESGVLPLKLSELLDGQGIRRFFSTKNFATPKRTARLYSENASPSFIQTANPRTSQS